MDYRFISDQKDDKSLNGSNGFGYGFPLTSVPSSPDKDVVERAVERILEEHSETLEKLADE